VSKILIIDDDVDFVRSTQAVLKEEAHTVVTAHNGKDGFREAKRQHPDLILLDVMMTHDTEGFEIAQQLKDDYETCHLPVIIITGIRKAKTLPFRFEPDEDWLPVKAVLEKPVPPEELLKAVDAALDTTSKKKTS